MYDCFQSLYGIGLPRKFNCVIFYYAIILYLILPNLFRFYGRIVIDTIFFNRNKYDQ